MKEGAPTFEGQNLTQNQEALRAQSQRLSAEKTPDIGAGFVCDKMASELLSQACGL
ncbi:MAG: hypothetical protein HQ402_03420 [Parcubacteria group bacterium]|nr:hypothetical protein [Parcubacteria group bacterium]